MLLLELELLLEVVVMVDVELDERAKYAPTPAMRITMITTIEITALLIADFFLMSNRVGSGGLDLKLYREFTHEVVVDEYSR